MKLLCKVLRFIKSSSTVAFFHPPHHIIQSSQWRHDGLPKHAMKSTWWIKCDKGWYTTNVIPTYTAQVLLLPPTHNKISIIKGSCNTEMKDSFKKVKIDMLSRCKKRHHCCNESSDHMYSHYRTYLSTLNVVIALHMRYHRCWELDNPFETGNFYQL